jgi:hypothetical protein
MTPDDWIAAGYKRHDVAKKEMNKLADFLLQKRFDDDEGKKYFITVYCYDRTKYPEPYRSHVEGNTIGYIPTAQFVLGDNLPHFNIEMNGIELLQGGIKAVEDWFEVFWKVFRQPYYEKWIDNAD